MSSLSARSLRFRLSTWKGQTSRRWTSLRPLVSQERVLLVASLVVALCCNWLFWTGALAGRDWSHGRTWVFSAAVFALLASVHFILFALLSTRRTIKPVLIGLSLISASALYYMQRYTVYFDTHMLSNVLHTQAKEARELLTPSMLLSVLAAAALPVAAMLWIRIPQRPWRRALWQRGRALLLALVVTVVAVLMAFQDLSSLMRNHKELRFLVTPANVMVAAVKVITADARHASGPRLQVGEDAHRPVDPKRRAQLLVIVVGETVRAQNWGLNHYARQTTPELSALDIINFEDVTACGTSTEVSLPCMFSAVGRRDYDQSRIRRQQSLLHVLDHAGLETRWIDNQTGCKGVCEGLPNDDIPGDADAELCDGRLCYDEILLRRLQQHLSTNAGDQVVVLHQLGNHGPGYSQRYPPAFRRFTPTCESADLGACSEDSIVNSYDDAILYTDHLLAQLIQQLAADSTRDSAMIYLSDHGESLGEHGLFLHGLPYAIAPVEQTKVPMLMWLSPGMQQAQQIDTGCLREEAHEAVGHDNLFHSVLGLLQVRSAVYEAQLDLFQPCRSTRLDSALAAGVLR